MSTTTQPDTISTAESRPELTLTRTFDAPRALVFEAWTQPEHLKHWFMAREFTPVGTSGEVRPGGAWRSEMRSATDEPFCHGGVYREVVENERLSFTHAWEDDDGKPEHETLITVSFEDAPDGGTRMTFHQAFFRTVESRDHHGEGWTQFFDHLESYMATLEPAAV